MKNIEDNYKYGKFSITAYQIKLSERLKYYGDHAKENAVDKSTFLANKSLFVTDFLNHLGKLSKNDAYNYFKIVESKDISKPEIGINAVELIVNFGKSAEDFLAVESSGKENRFTNTRIVKFYKVFFFCKANSECYVVVFRNGYNSCKTAILNEMKDYLSDTNILVNLVYTSNNIYIDKIYSGIEPVSLSFTTLFKQAPIDNADDTKIIEKKFSTTQIDLKSNSLKDKLKNLVMNIFRGGNDKQSLISQFEYARPNEDEYRIDPDSFTVVVDLGGVKRTVVLSDEFSFYDVDITSKLEFEKNKPTDESIRKEVFEYIEGIMGNN